jgi:hypothetical protein
VSDVCFCVDDQAFVELEDVQSAVTLITMYANIPFKYVNLDVSYCCLSSSPRFDLRLEATLFVSSIPITNL